MAPDLEVVPFEPRHAKDAAMLLARQVAEDRRDLPELPEEFEDPGNLVPMFEKRDHLNGPGFVAYRRGEMLGYLIARVFDQPGARRTANIIRAGHAVEAPDRFAVYHALYSALAERLIRSGRIRHAVTIPAGDAEVLGIWFRLGFGHLAASGIRDLSHVPGTISEVEVRRASPDDIDAVVELIVGLSLYHAGAPMFEPAIMDAEAVRRQHAERLGDSNGSMWLAWREGEALGLMTFTAMPPVAEFVSARRSTLLEIAFVREEERTSGVGAALLKKGVEWAHAEGHEHLRVQWATGNLAGERFWTAKGFKTAHMFVHRILDPDITWANERQDLDEVWRRW